jgi:hypothetical protein
MKILQRHVAYAAVVLSLPIAACAKHTPEPPVSPPQSVVDQTATPQAANPGEPTPTQPAPVASPAPSGATPSPSGTTPAPGGTTSARGGTTSAPGGTTSARGATTPASSGTAPAPKPSSKAAPPPSSKAAPPVARTPAPTAQAPKSAAPPVASQAAPVPLDLIALKEQLKATKAIGVFTKISLKNQVDDLMNKFSDYYHGKSKTSMAELRRSYDLLIMKVLSLLQDSDKKLASEVVSSREAIWALLSDPKKFATLQT